MAPNSSSISNEWQHGEFVDGDRRRIHDGLEAIDDAPLDGFRVGLHALFDVES